MHSTEVIRMLQLKTIPREMTMARDFSDTPSYCAATTVGLTTTLAFVAGFMTNQSMLDTKDPFFD